MKTNITTLALLTLLLTLLSSCHEKKTTRTIKTKIESPHVVAETQTMPPLSTTLHFSWGGSSCDATITRTADQQLDLVSDADGNHYYNNVIRLTISSPSKKILDREFHSSDFKNYIDNSYLQTSHTAMLNIGFSEVDDNRAVFVATIGSPDDMDDEYMLVQVRVTPQGGVSFAPVEELE